MTHGRWIQLTCVMLHDVVFHFWGFKVILLRDLRASTMEFEKWWACKLCLVVHHLAKFCTLCEWSTADSNWLRSNWNSIKLTMEHNPPKHRTQIIRWNCLFCFSRVSRKETNNYRWMGFKLPIRMRWERTFKQIAFISVEIPSPWHRSTTN